MTSVMDMNHQKVLQDLEVCTVEVCFLNMLT
uniref:Uncharacterized protein n=1 Tax=Arundo donax TaxID=35708 RepID=A0A0A9F9D6_ARUDO